MAAVCRNFRNQIKKYEAEQKKMAEEKSKEEAQVQTAAAMVDHHALMTKQPCDAV